MQMTIAHWKPPVAPTPQEQFLLKRLGRVRKLLGFLRLHRHELFDDAFQAELATMYRTTIEAAPQTDQWSLWPPAVGLRRSFTGNRALS
jgi:hypothetical protein